LIVAVAVQRADEVVGDLPLDREIVEGTLLRNRGPGSVEDGVLGVEAGGIRASQHGDSYLSEVCSVRIASPVSVLLRIETGMAGRFSAAFPMMSPRDRDAAT
jgi:hypothetical protein